MNPRQALRVERVPPRGEEGGGPRRVCHPHARGPQRGGWAASIRTRTRRCGRRRFAGGFEAEAQAARGGPFVRAGTPQRRDSCAQLETWTPAMQAGLVSTRVTGKRERAGWTSRLIRRRRGRHVVQLPSGISVGRFVEELHHLSRQLCQNRLGLLEQDSTKMLFDQCFLGSNGCDPEFRRSVSNCRNWPIHEGRPRTVALSIHALTLTASV